MQSFTFILFMVLLNIFFILQTIPMLTSVLWIREWKLN